MFSVWGLGFGGQGLGLRVWGWGVRFRTIEDHTIARPVYQGIEDHDGARGPHPPRREVPVEHVRDRPAVSGVVCVYVCVCVCV